MKKRILALVLALVLAVGVLPVALAEETPVAKIGDITYGTLDEAVDAEKGGVTVELLADSPLTIAKLGSKSITFTGNGTITVEKQTYDGYHGTLTLRGAGVALNWNGSDGTTTKPTATNGDWLLLGLSGTINVEDGALLHLEFDTGTNNGCNAIYMSAGSALNVTNGAKVEIIGRNTGKKAGQGIQLDEAGKSKVTVTGGSEFLIDGTNRGYVNSPVIYVEDSTFTVQNCTNNGSNGGKFTAINSNINFLNNKVLGLSTSDLTSTGSTFNLSHNGYSGLVTTGQATFDEGSKVYIEDNCKNTFNGYGAFFVGGRTTFAAGSTLSVTNNHASGIRVAEGYVSAWVNGQGAALIVEDGAKITVMNNHADREAKDNNEFSAAYGGDAYGGGIWTNATVRLPADAVIYNNYAKSAGDDIYVSEKKSDRDKNYHAKQQDAYPSITFGDVGTDWVLDDCNHMIDGWYEDGLEGDAPLRWNVHDTETATHIVKKNSGTYTEAIAYKAAHGEEYYEPGENPLADYILPALWLNTKDHYSYLIGYADGTVKPEGKITRAEVATIFFRLLTDDARAKFWMSTNNYTDVPADKWYNNAISTLSNMGVIGGYADGSFKPDAPISRAEFAKIAVSFSNVADLSYRGYFADVKESDWFSGFVAAAKDAGLIEGYNDGTFQPEKAITRAEVCTIVNRMLGRKPSASHMKISDRIDWPDVSVTDWYYEAIMEATNSHTYQMGQRVETWNDKLPQRDWALLETGWANAYTGNGGEVH